MTAPAVWRYVDFVILRSAGLAAHRLLAVTGARAGDPHRQMDAELDALRAEAGRGDFRDALWLASPEFLTRVAKRGANDGRPVEKLDRKLYAYLQRLCAKNDTISAYGPISYLRIDKTGRSRPHPLRLATPRREAKLSHWACIKLARALVANPRIAVAATLMPQPWIGSKELRALTALQAEVLAEMEAERHSLEDFATAGCDGPRRLEAALELIELGYCRPSLDPHPISFDGLETITASLGTMSAAPEAACVRDELLGIQSELKGLARTHALPRRMTAAQSIGQTLQRIAPEQGWHSPAGDPDRALFFEDAYAAARHPFLSSSDWRRVTGALDLPLRLMGARAAAKRSDWREWCVALLRARGLDGVVALEEIIESVGAASIGEPPIRLPRVEAFDRAVAGLLEISPRTAAGIHLGPAPVEQLLEEWPQPPMAFASPDVLFDAPPGGGATMILGEVHGTATVWSFLLKFAPKKERDAMRATLGAWLSCQDVTPCELMIGRRRGRSFLLDLPALAIEAAHPAGPNATGRLSFRDVNVDLATFTITDGLDRRLEFLRSGWTGPLADVLAVEVEDFQLRDQVEGARDIFTPRIHLGELILQRACWEVEASRLEVPLATAPRAGRRQAAAAIRQRLGLPQSAYVVTAPGEKAVYVDLESELSLDWLTHAVRGAQRLFFTEALPQLEDAWLETRQGRVCAEIRTTAFWGAGLGMRG